MFYSDALQHFLEIHFNIDRMLVELSCLGVALPRGALGLSAVCDCGIT